MVHAEKGEYMTMEQIKQLNQKTSFPDWKSINENPPEVDEALYMVAVVTESGKRVVVTALCNFENGKYFWEIEHNEFEIHDGKIIKWAEMPPFPEV